MSVPGIGPIISSAIVAAIGGGDAFSKGRDFAAWLGLVPKQISTGDRTILGKISKRGNRYMRPAPLSKMPAISRFQREQSHASRFARKDGKLRLV